MRNLEIKLRVHDLEHARTGARRLGARLASVSRDIDTYFKVPRGRLKLRQREGERHGTLIAYHRSDAATSRHSEYDLLHVDQPDTLRRMLDETLGTLIVVAKYRQVLLYGETRIHLDQVDGLGTFVELETVIRRQGDERARAEHEHVLRSLGLDAAEAVATSYSDLLLAAQAAGGLEARPCS